MKKKVHPTWLRNIKGYCCKKEGTIFSLLSLLVQLYVYACVKAYHYHHTMCHKTIKGFHPAFSFCLLHTYICIVHTHYFPSAHSLLLFQRKRHKVCCAALQKPIIWISLKTRWKRERENESERGRNPYYRLL